MEIAPKIRSAMFEMQPYSSPVPSATSPPPVSYQVSNVSTQSKYWALVRKKSIRVTLGHFVVRLQRTDSVSV